ncbi:MAG TPA: isoprenylcysteine carboxylmethyltransferase family protein [Oscillatoriaceae cyanobacterium]
MAQAERIAFGVLIGLIFLAQLAALVGLLSRGKRAENGSAWALVGAWYALLGASMLEAWRFPHFWPAPAWLAPVGAALFLLGAGLRAAAVRALRRHFSPMVELQPEHQLVTEGVYGRLRHPAYLGSLAWALSVPLMLESAAGLVVFVAAYLPALGYRIAVEERMLADHFGPAWTAYSARVPALLPRLWGRQAT